MSASHFDLDKFMAQLKAAEAATRDPVAIKAHINQCNQSYPQLISAEIEKLLVVRTQADIKKVLLTLYHLRERGTNAVWDKIKPELAKIARRQYGTMFTDEAIEAGKTLALNIEALGVFAAGKIAQFDINHQHSKQVYRAFKIAAPRFSLFADTSPNITAAKDETHDAQVLSKTSIILK